MTLKCQPKEQGSAGILPRDGGWQPPSSHSPSAMLRWADTFLFFYSTPFFFRDSIFTLPLCIVLASRCYRHTIPVPHSRAPVFPAGELLLGSGVLVFGSGVPVFVAATQWDVFGSPGSGGQGDSHS